MNFVSIDIVDIFEKNITIMTENEKYEKWRQIALLMVEEKRAFLDKPFEKIEKKDSVNVRKTKSVRI